MLFVWILSVYVFVPAAFGEEPTAKKWDEIFRRSAKIVAENKEAREEGGGESGAPLIVSSPALPAVSTPFVSCEKQGHIGFLTIPALETPSGAEVRTFLIIDGKIFNSYKESLGSPSFSSSEYSEE